MDAILIKGGRKLRGEVTISGAKNAALPLLASALLTGGRNTFKNVPDLKDVGTMAKVLSVMGAQVSGRRTLKVATSSIYNLEAPYELVRTMRASVLVLGPPPSTSTSRAWRPWGPRSCCARATSRPAPGACGGPTSSATSPPSPGP
jgi:UDP-N-acetylglucosamine enolpyruvyl transferase